MSAAVNLYSNFPAPLREPPARSTARRTTPLAKRYQYRGKALSRRTLKRADAAEDLREFYARFRGVSPLDKIYPAFKQSRTTGSMGAGSEFLTVDDPTWFEVGDRIIVEIGGEAGAGARGTMGVGGEWEADNIFEVHYYRNTNIPLSLVAIIVAIVGDVIELDTPSVAATTNATVWYDNLQVLQTYIYFGVALEGRFVFSNKHVLFPTGEYAFSDALYVGQPSNCIIQGRRTTIRAPKGCPTAHIDASQGDNLLLRDVDFIQNFRRNGYAHQLSAQFGVIYYGFGGVLLDRVTRAHIHNITSVDSPQFTVGLRYCTSTRVHRCTSTMTDAREQYIQWQFAAADGFENHFYDCVSNAPYLEPSFETFRGEGDRFIRCGGENAGFSSNTAGGWVFKDCYTVVKALSWYNNFIFSKTQPMFTVNGNIGGAEALMSLGGLIENFNCLFEGYVDAERNVPFAISGVRTAPYITVKGGVIQGPDYDGSMGAVTYGPHVGLTGDYCTYDGVQVIGTSDVDRGNLAMNPAAVGGLIQNCIADNIVYENATDGGGNVPNP